MAKLIVAGIDNLSRFNEIAEAISARTKVSKELLLAVACTFGNVREIISMAKMVDREGQLDEIIDIAASKIADDIVLICRSQGLSIDDIKLLMEAFVDGHTEMIRAAGGEL